MIYNEEKIINRFKLIDSIHNNMLSKDERIKRLNDLEVEEIHKLDEITERNNNLLFDKELSVITNEIENINNIVDKISELESDMDEEFEHLKDNKERHKKKEYAVSKELSMSENIKELNNLYNKILDSSAKVKTAGSVINRIISLIQDKIIGLREVLGFKQKLICIVIGLVLTYPLTRNFIYATMFEKIKDIAILIGLIIVGKIYIEKNFKNSSYGNLGRIYKVYNLIDYIKEVAEDERLRLDSVKVEKMNNIVKLSEKMKTISLDKIKQKYETKRKEVTNSTDTNSLDICELSVKESNLPYLANVNAINNIIPIYYSVNSLFIEKTDDSLVTGLLMENLIQEILYSEDIGNVKIKLVDTLNLGNKFKDVLKLKNNKLQIIDKKVYTNQDNISEMLDKMIEKIMYVLQNNLATKYDNVFEYNRDNESKVIYEFIFLQDIDQITDEKILDKINTIYKHGRNSGVFIIASGQIKEFISDNIDIDIIQVLSDKEVKLKRYKSNEVDYKLECINDEECLSKINDMYEKLEQESNKSLTFKDLMPNELWLDKPDKQMEVLIGIKDGGGNIEATLGGTGINHHILIGGNTGSGKTSFIHTFIISSCMKYSPEDLELILIDFKQGVEFKLYEDYKLPHAKFLGLESDREYALNILKYLNVEIEKRSKLCKEYGATDLTSYNAIEDIPARMKRIVIIIDEFQELLRGEDNIEQETRVLFDIITRLGRSYGIHLILCSQSISGIPGGLGGVENRLGTRIALRCNEDDSRAILSSNNPAAADLDRIGQGIFNDNQGRLAANQKFMFGYIDDELRKDLLNKIRNKAKEIGYISEAQVFYRSHLRNISEVEWFDEICSRELKADETNLLLGDSSSLIKKYVDIDITRQSGENLIIVTKNKNTNKNIVDTMVKSLCVYNDKEAISDEGLTAKIIMLNAGNTKGTDYVDIEDIPETIIYKDFGLDSADALINNMQEIIEERQYETDKHQLYPIYFIINNIQRIRELQEDEYSSDVTKTLNRVLRDGTYVGIHTICILDTYKSLDRIKVKLINESNHRLIGRMGDMDSLYTINSKVASTIDNDNELIYYNDISGVYDKVRVLKTN